MGYSSSCVTTVFSTPTNSLTRCSQTGLFSAAVASLISVSIQDLQQNPQDTSNFYLANIYQATINPNASSSLPSSPPPFSPPNYAVWVNALWFLSLAISLTCALLATLLQQWARRYLKVTQSRYSLHKRARIRAFFAEGVEKLLLPRAVEILPGLLHISLFLFFAGLVVFLRNINLTIFKLVLSWVGVCTALYGCVTVIPIFRHDSPYYTSLSSLVWLIVVGIRCVVAQVYGLFILWRLLRRPVFARYIGRYYEMLLQGMHRTAEETALNSPPEVDTRAFMWTLDCLDEDHELERFFTGLPGFRSSKVVKDPLLDLTTEEQEKLLDALIGLLDRTFSSDLLPEPTKNRRVVICAKAIGPAGVPGAIDQLVKRILSRDLFQSEEDAELMLWLRGWANGKDEETTITIRAIISSVLARAQRRDDLWFAIASDEMGVPESVLRNHVTYGNNLSLTILIHVVRQQFSLFKERHWPRTAFWKVLEVASKFDVLNTSPELQHEFCALWNQVVRAANCEIASGVLRPIRNTYLTLHLHTDSAPTKFSAATGDEDGILAWESSYPLCNIPGHNPDSSTHSTHIHNDTPTSIPPSVLPENAALVLDFPPDEPALSLAAPVRNPVNVPLLDVSAPLYDTHQMVTESVLDSAISPDPVTASASRNNPFRMVSSTTRKTPTPTSVVAPLATVSLQNNVHLLAHSGAPEIPASASPEAVLDDITGPSLLTIHLLISQSH
jgi:hypothetical protein